MRILVLFLILTLHAAGQSTFVRTFTHGSITREYKVYIPASYDPALPAPLVLNLHGYGSDMDQQEVYGDFRSIADTAGFILVHPNGTFDTSFKRYWNAYGLTTIDDLGFLSALIDTVDLYYNINLNKVYSTGLSNGAIMSYYLACNLSSKITAIGAVAGSMTHQMKSPCNAQHPTPVIAIHGTADAVVPYTGSSVFLHTDSVISFWRSFNDCSITPVVTNVTNINTSDGCTATRYDHENGASGSKVAFYKISGGGHSWPGAPVNIAVTNHDFSASIEIWKFFRGYSLGSLLTTETVRNKSELKVFPNPACDLLNVFLPVDGELLIYNINGELVFTQQMQAGDHLINTEDYSSGIYLLKVIGNGPMQTIKFIRR